MPYLEHDDPFILILVIISGLIFGSFATAVAYRLPQGKNFVSGRSKCTKCNHNLGFFDLIPVFSWLFSGGKCRHCGVKVSASYPAIEISLAIMFVIIYQKFGLDIRTPILFALAVFFMIMIVIDFAHYIIPDSINISMFIIGLIYQILSDAPMQQLLLGPLIGLTIGLSLRWLMFFWKKKEGLGMGDVKFLIIVGLFLTPELIITFLFLSGVIGILISVLWRILKKGEEFPFGPALALSLFICVVLPEFHDWWFRLMETVSIKLIG